MALLWSLWHGQVEVPQASMVKPLETHSDEVSDGAPFVKACGHEVLIFVAITVFAILNAPVMYGKIWEGFGRCGSIDQLSMQ